MTDPTETYDGPTDEELQAQADEEERAYEESQRTQLQPYEYDTQPRQQTEIGHLILVAIEKDLDDAKLERLLNLREQYERHEAEKGFHRAKAAFQRECPPIPHDCKGIARTEKGAIEWTYASLGMISRTVAPYTGKHGLSWHWEDDETNPERRKKICILTHERGHKERSTFLLSTEGQKGGLANMTEQQQEGGADKYARSRTLQSVLGIGTADQDLDGAQPSSNVIEEWEMTALKRAWWYFGMTSCEIHTDMTQEELAKGFREFSRRLVNRDQLQQSWKKLCLRMINNAEPIRDAVLIGRKHLETQLNQKEEHDGDETNTADRQDQPEEHRTD